MTLNMVGSRAQHLGEVRTVREMAALSEQTGHNIRAERSRVPLTQTELAEAIGPGYTKSIISETESAKRALKVDELPLFCRALQVTLHDLLKNVERRDLDALGL